MSVKSSDRKEVLHETYKNSSPQPTLFLIIIMITSQYIFPFMLLFVYSNTIAGM